MSERFAPTVAEVTGQGMLTLRADLAAPDAASALKTVGLPLPAPRRIETAGARQIAWMSPDELLLLCPGPEVAELARDLEAALGGLFATLVDVSDARVVFEINGPGTREALAKLTPVDLHPAQFGPGEMRRTRLGQVAAALWMPAPDQLRVMCFRSVHQYVADLLTNACDPAGALRVFAD